VFTGDVVVEHDLLANIHQAAERLPKVFGRAVRQSVVPGARKAIRDSLGKPPGKVHHPIQWTNDRQRRKVMGFVLRDAQGHFKPYQRTGALVAGWDVEIDEEGGFTRLTARNPSKIMPFVQGNRQQRFHRNTGWQNVADVLQVVSLDIADRLEALWAIYTAAVARGEVE
jgi:hypothetical protein